MLGTKIPRSRDVILSKASFIGPAVGFYRPPRATHTMEQPYDCCPVLTEFVLLDNVVSHLGAPRDILAASHGES